MTCLCAWGDESIRFLGPDAPAYLLGASVLEPTDTDAIRDALRALHRSGRKLHWHDLDRSRRRAVTEVVVRARAVHIVVVARRIDLRRQERARARCLERLGWELGRLGVRRLTLESRAAALDARDRRTVDAARVRRAFPPGLRVEHGAPEADALLWLPDQVLGIVGRTLAADGDTSALALVVEVVEPPADGSA